MNLFVSYRRDDTRDFAGRLAERLRATPGIGHVFIDVDGIEPGADFQSKIEAALVQSEACLVVIGPEWLGGAGARAARISRADDFVRLELRMALSSGRRVLPVLANGATMPAPADLPEDVRGLTRFNAVTLRHESFDRDAEYLADALLGRRKRSRTALSTSHPVAAAVLRGAAGFCAGLFVLIFGLAILNAATGRSLDQVVGGRGPTYVVVAALLAAATAAPFLLRQRPHRGE